MPLIETESLVLKSYNLAEADKIVVLLTREHGVVRAVAKGAKRLKSRFGSGLEPFSEVRAVYFQKENVELVSLQKTDLIKSSFSAAANPEFLHKFSYLCDLLLGFLPPHDPNEKIYRMVRASVASAAARSERLASIGVYFELWLLKLSGYLPEWTRCGHCRRVLEKDEDANIQADFHLLCRNCRKTSSRMVMDWETREIVAAASRFSPEEFAEFTIGRDETVENLSSVLKPLISMSIGREVTSETSLAVKANSK